MSKLILDLCAGSGAWSTPYLKAGYDVRRYDLALSDAVWPTKHINGDVRLMFHEKLRVHGILAAPPCTVFSYARNRYEPTDDELIAALSVVDACLRAVALYRPVWWALENPVNKLRRYLGPPAWTFRHWEYGDPAEKPTALWGTFTPPLGIPGPRTKPSTFKTRQQNAEPGDAITPAHFAQAFFESNP